MLAYESDDDVEFRSAWESSFNAEKQSHIAQRRQDKVDSRIEHLKSRISFHRQESEESLRLSALQAKGLASVQKQLGDITSELQDENAAVEELSALLQLAQAKKRKSEDKLASFMELRKQHLG